MVLLVQVELKFGMLVGTQRKIVGARTRTNNKPTNDTRSGNQTRATVVDDKSSHHCASLAPFHGDRK